MIASLVIGCAGSDPHTDVVRLPDPVPLRTAEPFAPSAQPTAEPVATEPHRPILPKRRPPGPDSEDGPDASSTERERARELFKQGVEAYGQGDYPKACAAFEAAYELVPERPLLFNIASCEMRMGHTPKACDLFRKYVANGDPSDPRVVEVSQQIANRCP